MYRIPDPKPQGAQLGTLLPSTSSAIWKWTVPFGHPEREDGAELIMPRGAHIVGADLARDGVGRPADLGRGSRAFEVWGAVDTDAPLDVAPRRFTVVGTGHPLPAAPGGVVHIAVAVDSIFRWHLLELLP